MGITIVRNDITRMAVDAIVNPTNRALRPTGGTDAAIHRAAGPELRQACRRIGSLQQGRAAITDGYSLPCRYVIHTVGPSWMNGKRREREILADCYRSCLELAERNGCRSVAFPLIAAGTLGFPKDQALYIALSEIRSYLKHADLDVTVVVYGLEEFRLSQKLQENVRSYIDRNYILEHRECERQRFRRENISESIEEEAEEDVFFGSAPVEAPRARPRQAPRAMSKGAFSWQESRPSFSLSERLGHLDEGFSQMLLRKIDESGMTDAECYKKARIDRKLFSKIRSDPHYRPSKVTVLAFVIALELPLPEARSMLEKAGFALSHSSVFDVIVEYFLQEGIYDLYKINEALFEYDQILIGA